MTVLRSALGAALLTVTAGSAAAGFSNGDVVFTNAAGDSIGVIRASDLSIDTLLSVTDPTNQIRFGGINRAHGSWYVNSGLNSADAGVPGKLLRIDNLFSGAASLHDVSVGDPLQNPIGLGYHSASDQFVAVNNTVMTQMQAAPDFDGIIGIDRTTGGTTILFDELVGSPITPRYKAGANLDRRAGNVNQFFVASINGGAFADPMPVNDRSFGSALYTVSMDTSGNATVEEYLDLSDTDFGPLTFVRDMTSAIGDDGTLDIYFADGFTNALYRVDTDAAGNATTISQILTGLDNPEMIVYNKYTNTLFFDEQTTSSIYQVNLDGTGLELIASGVDVRDFYVVPAPGAAGLFGLAGLVACRRRR